MINLFRPNMPKGLAQNQQIPLKLEVIFPIMYPRHQLIGLNHQAFVDYQQTRLVCKAFNELCRPTEERGEDWEPDTVARAAQTSIIDWLQDERAIETGKGKVFCLRRAIANINGIDRD
jgi:hypothetical protein